MNVAFERWLTRSTRGLEAATAALIREELTAHYEDLVADYVAQGNVPAQAEQMALQALGDEKEVAQGFQETHAAPRRYLLAAVVGITYPLWYWLALQWTLQLTGTLMFNLAIFLPLIYVLYGFKVVLTSRPHGTDFTLYSHIIQTGIVALCVPRFFAWIIYHQPMIAEAYTRTLGDAHSTAELALNGIALFGLFLTATGFMLMGERALHLRERLYGLLKPIGVLIILCGFCLGVYSLGVIVGDSTLRETAELFAVLSGMIVVMMWSMIFFRARGEMVHFA